MDKAFTSTHWRDTMRNMLVNNEQILYVEKTEGEYVTYTVMFDNGQTLDLDEPTGRAFSEQLEKVRHSRSEPMRYSERKDYLPPRPRRGRSLTLRMPFNS